MSLSARSKPILDTRTAPEQRNRSRQQLARIAAALNLPGEVFFDEPSQAVSSGEQASGDPHELYELMRLFEAITDPVKRRACLALIRDAAERG